MLKDELNQHGIGNTIFTRSRNIEKLLHFNQIFLKFEGGNPTGTMKDRASYACLKLAKEQGYTVLAIASCGNFGASFVHIAQDFGIEVHVYIPERYHTDRINEIQEKGGIIHRVAGTYEEVVEYSVYEAEKIGWFNGNPGVKQNTIASMEAYSTISYEIFEQLGHSPDFVSVPVGNGSTLAGVNLGFKRLYEAGKSNKIPVMVGTSTSGGNPVVDCHIHNERIIRDLLPSEIVETEYNEPLVSWRSFDGQEALDALWESKGWSTYISDQDLISYSELLAHEEGLLVLPASSSSLVGLKKYNEIFNVNEGRDYVAVLTARRH